MAAAGLVHRDSNGVSVTGVAPGDLPMPHSPQSSNNEFGVCEGGAGPGGILAQVLLSSCLLGLVSWRAGCTIVSCAVVNSAGGSSDNVTHSVIGTVRILLAAVAILAVGCVGVGAKCAQRRGDA